MKGNMKKLKIAVIMSLVLAIAVFIVVLAAEVTIDTFDNGDAALTVWSSSTTDSNVYDGTGIIGGERDTVLTFDSGPGGVDLYVDQYTTTNELIYAASPGSKAIGEVTWDGNDGSATLAPEGLGNANLVSADPDNDAIVISVTFADAPTDLTLIAFENGDDYGTQTLRTPGDISSGNRVDMVYLFTGFTDHEDGEDFLSLGALQLIIDGTVTAATDISIDNLEASNARDYGDLDVDNYDIASHITDGLRLGESVDVETGTQESGNAGGDDYLDGFDDEDGVARDMADKWQNGATVGLNVTVKGCSGTCYLNGWIDWKIINKTLSPAFTEEQTVTNGVNALTVTIPNALIYNEGDPVFSRFRLCDSAEKCDETFGEVIGGEVEDYYWDFGPTAVTISTLEARSPWLTSPYTLGAAVLLLVAMVGGLVVAQRRKA